MRFFRIKHRIDFSRGVCLALLAMAGTPGLCGQDIHATNQSAEERIMLTGRILADRPQQMTGAGLGPHSIIFIFGVRAKGKDDADLLPVLIEYQYFKSSPALPKDFFDYSKLYSLRVTREPRCDISLSDFSYMKAVDESGNPLPPSFVLRPMEGAPVEHLRQDMTLACYALRPGHYKLSIINETE